MAWADVSAATSDPLSGTFSAGTTINFGSGYIDNPDTNTLSAPSTATSSPGGVSPIATAGSEGSFLGSNGQIIIDVFGLLAALAIGGYYVWKHGK